MCACCARRKNILNIPVRCSITGKAFNDYLCHVNRMTDELACSFLSVCGESIPYIDWIGYTVWIHTSQVCIEIGIPARPICMSKPTGLKNEEADWPSLLICQLLLLCCWIASHTKISWTLCVISVTLVVDMIESCPTHIPIYKHINIGNTISVEYFYAAQLTYRNRDYKRKSCKFPVYNI